MMQSRPNSLDPASVFFIQYHVDAPSMLYFKLNSVEINSWIFQVLNPCNIQLNKFYSQKPEDWSVDI